MSDRSLRIVTANSGQDRIGLLQDNGLKIVVPANYLNIQEKKYSTLTNEERKKLKKLIHGWRKYQKHNKDLNYDLTEGSDSLYDFDLIMSIIQDFVQNGIYIEYEVQKQVKNCGRIEFADTLKKCKPILTENGAVFLDYYSKAKKIVDQNLLRDVQIQVLNEISKDIGWLLGFNVFIEPRNNINLLGKDVSTKLKKMRNFSFNSRKLQLIQYLVEYINMKASLQNNNHKYFVGTAFHFWETMVSETIGNISKRRMKKIFYVRHAYINRETQAKIYESKPLMPDSIYCNENFIFVIDAKYYVSGNLPDNYDITKQFAYMDKAYGYYHKKGEYKYKNVMVLPTDEKTKLSEIQIYFDMDIETDGSKVPIDLYYINFAELLDCYLQGSTYPLDDLIGLNN